MIAYWIAFLLPAVAVLSPFRSSANLRRALWLVAATGFILFIGLRHEVGADWLNYLDQFYRLQGGEGQFSEPGYGLVNRVAVHFGWDIHAVNLFCASVFIAGLVFFCVHEKRPWLAFTVSIPYIVIVVGMGYTKQAVALGILLWGLVQLQRGRTLRYVLSILAAMTFHVSALIGFVFAAMQLRRGGFRFAVVSIILLSSVVIAFVVSQLESLSSRFAVVSALESGGAYVRIGMNVTAFALLVLFRKRFRHQYGSMELWVWMGLLSVGCLLAVPYAATAADRLALFFSPVQIVVFGRLPSLMRSDITRTQTVFAILAGYASVLWIWMNFGTNADYWLPYQNVLFDWLTS